MNKKILISVGVALLIVIIIIVSIHYKKDMYTSDDDDTIVNYLSTTNNGQVATSFLQNMMTYVSGLSNLNVTEYQNFMSVNSNDIGTDNFGQYLFADSSGNIYINNSVYDMIKTLQNFESLNLTTKYTVIYVILNNLVNEQLSS
jgi:hypothetical protein